MNSIFKELLDEGRIDPTPVFECEGRKAYQFSGDGAGMSQSRFETLGDVLQAYSAFNLEQEDIDLYFEITKKNTRKALLNLKSDPESSAVYLEQNQQLTSELEARREYSVPINRMYNFMSFIVIEEDETPLIYNEQYNKEKIKRWKKDLSIEKKIPFLKVMLPLFPNTSKLLELDSLNSIRVQNLQNATTLRIIQKGLDLSGAEKEINSSINSRLETLKDNEYFLTELSRTITDMLQNTEENK